MSDVGSTEQLPLLERSDRFEHRDGAVRQDDVWNESVVQPRQIFKELSKVFLGLLIEDCYTGQYDSVTAIDN